ncbi:MAG: APC family permease [Solirubrobacterales bacterium]|nr:APC family permease [Solirubrobacterales bacterium]
MATAVVEERQLLKTLRWWDGFAIALCNPGFLFGSLGYTLGVFGVLGSVIMWGASAIIGWILTWIYVEPAMMFPNKSGGISLYAHEAWRKYTTLVGPIATFGYWIGWSVVLAIFSKIIGDLIEARWFPHSTWSVWDGSVHLGLSNFIAVGVIIGVWAFNIFGIRPMKGLTYLTGGLLTIALFVLIVVPYLTGDWHSSNVHATFTGPWGGTKLVFVYLFILGWSSWAAEVCATFAPEYKSQRDCQIALRSSALFVVGVFALIPLGLGGVSGVPPTATQEGQFYSTAFQTIAGHTLGTIFLICLIASLVLSMSSSTADGGRALYGISKAGMTIKQLGVLNKYHVPGRAMTVDLFVNCALVLFISSNLAILYMSNIGYVLCHLLAVSGFLLLRKDRPNWPRPIRLGRIWTPIAAFMSVFILFILIVGAGAPHLNGYGTWTDFFIGVGVLAASVLLFIFRRVVQDGETVHFREQTPTMPEPSEAAAVPAASSVAPAAS